ncbi:MAG: RecQ family ATP-dependent DNA helicase [Acidobacteria bacterium]|nr:RecQ family ATP-dependent DNA helicase [Acidobacteriota bacterium]
MPGGSISMMPFAEPGPELFRHFGHPGFRTGQEDVVRAVLAGRDVLAVMPTGSGKSIGYQLPAVLLEGTTLVVSPLISLMKDQVDELLRRGIRAAAIHSGRSHFERGEALRAARAGSLDLLYVAPERFASDSFRDLLAEIPVALFAVDEAHCVSEWGHDFRPDYRTLRAAADRCHRPGGAAGRPPIAAFTATATPEVRTDIVTLLGLTDPAVFVAGFDRPNLYLDVRRVSGEIEKCRLLPGLVGNRRALVYTATRKSAERAAAALQSAGLPAEAYHAGLDEAERTRVQDAFARGTLPAVCATNAFGMGIDRPDVDAVVHFEIPGSLEAYYQEIGRGGRDGRRADTTLLWNYVDVRTREFFIDRDDTELDPRTRNASPDPEQRERKRELDRAKLRRMIAYADATGCLRATLLRYFGEREAPSRCGFCGNCARRAPLGDADLLILRKVLSGIARAGERWGKRKIAAMLIGRLEDLPDSLAGLSTTGILSDLSAKAVESWVEAASGAELLRASDDVYRTLSLTRLGRDVMAGRASAVELTLPPPPESRPPRRKKTAAMTAALMTADAPEEAVVDRLRAWRREEASRRGVPAYVVFHDKTLLAIATARPRTLSALGQISGIGPAKLQAYGAALLEALETEGGRR